jgi:hypothetical protein
MKTNEISLDALDAAARVLPSDRPVFMLNLLRYRETATYQGRPEEKPCTGREAYHERYIPAFRRLAAGLPIKRLFFGSVFAKLVGPANAQWDDAAINEYADFATFRAVVDSEGYRREADHHRRAALDDFRLFVLDRVM